LEPVKPPGQSLEDRPARRSAPTTSAVGIVCRHHEVVTTTGTEERRCGMMFGVVDAGADAYAAHDGVP
jgi:hypothetical protein